MSEDLRIMLHNRRVCDRLYNSVDLGDGFIAMSDGEWVYLIHEAEPGERARIGRVEDTQMGDRWVIYREWYHELVVEFGLLPAHMVIDGIV